MFIQVAVVGELDTQHVKIETSAAWQDRHVPTEQIAGTLMVHLLVFAKQDMKATHIWGHVHGLAQFAPLVNI